MRAPEAVNSIHWVAARLIALICLAAAFSGRAQEPDVLGPDAWPKTLEAAVKILIQQLPPAEQSKLKAMKREDLILLHHGFGTQIRNNFGLWRGNTDLIASACGRPCHPDAASMIIIEATWQELQKRP